MKTIYPLATAFLTLPGASNTQAGVPTDTSPAVQIQAAALTRTLAAQVYLDESQYGKVKQLNEDLLMAVEKAKTRYAAYPALQDQRLAEIQARYEADLSALMRPVQLALYQRVRANGTAPGTTPK